MKCSELRTLARSLGVLAAFGAAACGSDPAADDAPIRIATSLPITGDFGEAGTRHLKGYQLCAKLLNESGGVLGRRVQLDFQDNESDPAISDAQHQALIADPGVHIIFGTFSTLLGFTASAMAEEAGRLYPMPSSAARRVYERGFQNIFYFQQKPAEDYAQSPLNALAHYSSEMGQPFPTTAAVVWVDDFFGGAVANGLLGNPAVEIPNSDPPRSFAVPSALAEFGIMPANIFQLTLADPPEETDWQALRDGLAAAVPSPEILFASMSSPEQAVRLVEELKDNTAYQPNAVWITQGTQASFHESLQAAVNGIIHQASWHPDIDYEGRLADAPFTNAQFLEAYRLEFDEEADEDVAITFALCQGVEQAIRATGTTDNLALSAWLHDRTAADPVSTILGDFHWDEKGLPIERDFLLTQWQDEELRFVFPIDEFPGTVPLMYPKPQW